MPQRPRPLAPIPRLPGLRYDVLDSLIGYALRRAQVAVYGAFGRATRGLDMTPPRFTALVIVGANPGISQSTLGASLSIARSGAMSLVDWMVARGLIERRSHPEDRRAWGLHLTSRGERFVNKIKRNLLEEERKQVAVLSGAEKGKLLRLLDRIAAYAAEGT